MSSVSIEEIIRLEHSGDNEQLQAIFSDLTKIIVEAPAGCGKTKTMISKIAHLLATNKVPINKKILALTFSVNAAYKIKKEVAVRIPSMAQKTPNEMNSKMFISNYHGFARRMLSLYGYLVTPNLTEIKEFESIDDSKVETIMDLKIGIDFNDAVRLTNFNEAVKNIDIDTIKVDLAFYLNIIEEKFLPNKLIPYNAYLLLCRKLLLEHKELRNFLQKLYPIIIVDEFQDTNILSWQILKLLITDNSSIFLMGDSLQRIYGFIGAIPNLIDKAQRKYSMEKIVLQTNYRFKGNPDMLLLDKNLRANSNNYMNPEITEISNVQLELFDDQIDEASWIVKKIQEILSYNDRDKVAIITQQRGNNLNRIIEFLEHRKIPYFSALFTEDDQEYVSYHRNALRIFYEVYKAEARKRISSKFLFNVIQQIKENYGETRSNTIKSLIELNDIFFRKLQSEYSFLNDEEKLVFINDTFENRALKQNIEFVQSRIVVSTVHGAKGLEWEYVLLPDMEQYVFPNYPSLCGVCNFQHNKITGDFCKLNPSPEIERKYLEELCVFYVAVTRARKQVFFSSSKLRIHNDGRNKRTYVSCLLSLPGLKVN